MKEIMKHYLQNDILSNFHVFIRLSVIVLVLKYAIVYIHKIATRNNSRYTLPPLSPNGMFQTIKDLSAPTLPFFYINTAKKLKSEIYRLNIPGDQPYVIGDPTIARDILLDPKSEKPSSIYGIFEYITGHPCLFTYPNSHPKTKGCRKALFHAFGPLEIQRMNSVCMKHVDNWIEENLDQYVRDRKSFDPGHEMCYLAFKSLLESAFEYEATEDEYKYWSHHMEISLRELVYKQLCNPLLKLIGFLLPEIRAAKMSAKNVQSFAQKILNAYRNNENKSDHKTMIRLIVENETFKSDEERVAEIITLVAAGHDTTAFSISTTIILIAHHQNVQDKLRREILATNPSDWSSNQYLKDVITESNRLYPVAADGPARHTLRDFVTKDNILIPKGAICFLPQVLAHRSHTVFSDPDSFDPERWKNADKTMRNAIVTFALGNRNCIGQSLALAELYSVIPRLLSEFELEVEEDGELDFFLTWKFVGTRLLATRK